ncbi:MAG: ATP-binding protein [Candidatus Nomurabacteria bacterium]|jgi:predicted AAA+ superfamily ATPase|nr:ATP-binding protein [Candidatus Nomurabacteria bacterium]
MIEREIWQQLAKELKTKEVMVITGPRQVGKTTTVKWLLEQVKQNKLYLDLTLTSVQTLFEYEDYDNIVNQLKGMGLDFDQRVTIAIDEIQYSKIIPRAIKYLYDHYDIKFILTGSSAFYLKNHFSESLSARKLIFELLPLSFREFLQIQNVKYLPPPANLRQPAKWQFDKYAYETLKSYYDEYIEFGGFPAVAASEGIERKKQMLDTIYSSYINLDVEQLADFRSISDLKRLVSLLGARVGSRLNIDELANIIGLSRPTISTYLAFLEQTYLIRLLPAYSKSADIREKLPKKVYFVDTGIANLNADLSGGAKFENTICHQLARIGKLAFYNVPDGEIDLIVDGKLAIEVKETPTEKFLTTLARRAGKVDIKDYGLVGRQENEKFSHYLWGGMI